MWVMVRPHNWRPKTREEVLMELDSRTGIRTDSVDIHQLHCPKNLNQSSDTALPPKGKELSRVKVPSRFTHDAVSSLSTEGGAGTFMDQPNQSQPWN